RGGALADAARELDVAAGDAADVVAAEGDAHLWVAECDVGMVARRLCGLPDAIHELEPDGEALRREHRGEPLVSVSPVREPGVSDGRGRQQVLGIAHASILALGT